ncbi:MAG: hypothetical protein AAF389_05795 [Gemmatimonadota bacterium]
MRSLTAAAALILVLPTAVAAQSAADIVDRMLDSYADRARGVEDYTIVQETMGLESLAYFEKTELDGRPVFQLRRTRMGEMAMGAPSQSVDEIYALGADLAGLARYEGIERVDHYDVHVLDVPDLSGVDFGRNVTEDSEFAPTRGRLYLDVDTYAPRRLVFDGEMTSNGSVHTVTSVIDMGDYREVEGMLFPFRTAVTIEGLAAAIDPETRAQFEEMQAELERMPEGQRRMVEAMMAEQLEQFRALMDGEDTGMSVTVLVREVLVNEGPPGN